MWELGPSIAAAAALLVPAAPGPVPSVPPPHPEVGCIVPLSTVLDDCPREDRGPLVLCVLPVTGLVPVPVEPDCPEPVPDQRGRIVPVAP